MTKTNLGIRLLYANSESEVQDIINSDPEMKKPGNWYPLDDRDTNHNTVGNQSSNGGKAATELITNMVDAILTKRCLEEGIDPKSDQAPKTMYEAVDKFIKNLQGGKISDVDDEKWLKEYAEKNLIIGLTGKLRKDPCYVFCDNGEGQCPENFTKTFLSLRVKNKSQIRFVQGKYNMGSSGVLIFAAQWFKLILSRRYDGESPWGWTLIRRNSPKNGEEDYAEYFALGGKENIQKINGDPIYPLVNSQGNIVQNFYLNTGTIVKLYDYYAGMKVSSFREPREIFNENLIETILPFRIYDCRQAPTEKKGDLRAQGVDDRAFYGLEFLMLRSYKEEKGLGDSKSGDIQPESQKLEDIDTITTNNLGTVSVSAMVLKEKAKDVSWYKNSRSRVFHHVNGQVHYKELRGVLSDWDLKSLMDRVVIFIDASNLRDSAHKEIWKPDRETLKDTKLCKEYKNTVKKIIKESPVLKALNFRIAKEKMEFVAKDSSKEIVKDLLKQDKNFKTLLSGDVPDVTVHTEASQQKEEKLRDDLKYEPSYIKFLGRTRSVNLPINKSRPIICETDAEDSFLTRSQNRGDIIFSSDDVNLKCSYARRLKNGMLFLSVQPSQSEFKPGESIKFKVGLNAMSMNLYTEDEMVIKFTNPEPKRNFKPRLPNPTESKMAGLPKHFLVTKDGRELPGDLGKTQKWDVVPVDNFNEKDGGYVEELIEGEKAYYINYDNAYFQNHLQSAKQDGEKTRIQQKYILGMRIFLLSVERSLALSKNNLKKIHEGNFADAEEHIRRLAAEGASSVVLILSETLPRRFDKDDDDE